MMTSKQTNQHQQREYCFLFPQSHDNRYNYNFNPMKASRKKSHTLTLITRRRGGFQYPYPKSSAVGSNSTVAEAWKMRGVHEIGVSGIAFTCMRICIRKILGACTFSTVCPVARIEDRDIIRNWWTWRSSRHARVV